VLRQCYGDKNAVTDELVQAILKPGLQVGHHASSCVKYIYSSCWDTLVVVTFEHLVFHTLGGGGSSFNQADCAEQVQDGLQKA